MHSGLSPWRGEDIPDKVGTGRCNSATSLRKNTAVSPSSTIMTEPTSSCSTPRGVLVAKIVTTLWGERWVPLKLISTSDYPVLVRRNEKLADVYPVYCLRTWMLLRAQKFPWSAALNQRCHLLLMQILPKTSLSQLGSVLLMLSHVTCQRTVRGGWLTLFCSTRMSFHATILTVGRQMALYTTYTRSYARC